MRLAARGARQGRPRSASVPSSFLLVAGTALLIVTGCGGAGNAPPPPSPPGGEAPGTEGAATPTPTAQPAVTATPANLADGERLFDANCARCHGARGSGTEQGPPLVHIIYEPNHHGDAAFQRAAAMGVRAHHWTFGDMPPVSGVTPEQVDSIVAYVRWLQRQAGIGG